MKFGFKITLLLGAVSWIRAPCFSLAVNAELYFIVIGLMLQRDYVGFLRTAGDIYVDRKANLKFYKLQAKVCLLLSPNGFGLLFASTICESNL